MSKGGNGVPMYRRDETGKRLPAGSKKQGRWYADLRRYSDVGGKRHEALVPIGQRVATTNATEAQSVLADRISELERKRSNRTLLGIEDEAALHDFAAHHLEKKAEAGKVTTGWLERSEMHLRNAIAHFGADRNVATINVRDVEKYITALKSQPSQKGGTISDGTVRHYLNSLSNLFRRAVAEGYITVNPVAALIEKPSASVQEAAWLEVHEAALILESARTHTAVPESSPNPFMYELIATFLLTGGRRAEVFGLEVSDVSFDRERVTFRPNKWRRLKTRGSHRSVPLWPQLSEILLAYLNGPYAPDPNGLLFPSARGTGMVVEVRKQFDGIAKRVGWAAGEIRTKAFRHTYTAARLQTGQRLVKPDSDTEVWIPTAPFTVGRELGHGGSALVDRIYGHLGEHLHRGESVEYRIDQWRDVKHKDKPISQWTAELRGIRVA